MNRFHARRTRGPIRKVFGFVDGIKLSKMFVKGDNCNHHVIDFCDARGIATDVTVTGFCPSDGFPQGFITCTNAKGQVCKIGFGCTGCFLD